MTHAYHNSNCGVVHIDLRIPEELGRREWQLQCLIEKWATEYCLPFTIQVRLTSAILSILWLFTTTGRKYGDGYHWQLRKAKEWGYFITLIHSFIIYVPLSYTLVGAATNENVVNWMTSTFQYKAIGATVTSTATAVLDFVCYQKFKFKVYLHQPTRIYGQHAQHTHSSEFKELRLYA